MNSDLILLLTAFVGLCLTFLAIYCIFGYENKKVDDNRVGRELQGKQRKERRGDRGLAALRRRRGRLGDNEDLEEKQENPPDSDGDDGNNDAETATLTKKQMMKQLKKQERDDLRRYDEAVREENRRKENAKNLEYQKKLEEQERIELEKEKEAERLRLEKENKEQQEFEKWKGMFQVELEGSTATEENEESQELLEKFISYIKKHKIVVLEDLAAEFGLQTQDAMNRVQHLEEMGRLTGIFDDRGKFIYITIEEMEKVAKFINKKGRVSISALSAASNRLLDLDQSKE